MATRVHNHSDYSNTKYLDCINKVQDIIDWSIKTGVRASALTDHESLSGHYKFWNYANQINARGEKLLQNDPNNEKAKLMAEFKPILGNEIYLTRENLNKETHDKAESFYHLILLAKDKTGWEQLNELSSMAWQRMYVRGIPRTPTYISDLKNVIGKNPGHLIATTACLGGVLGKMYQKNIHETDSPIGFVNEMVSIFGDSFYLELQPSLLEPQIGYNAFLAKLANKTGVKAIIATDAHYPRPEDKDIHWAYLTSQKAERELADFYNTTYFMSDEEIMEFFIPHFSKEQIEEFLINTDNIADRIERYSLKANPRIPRIPYANEDKWSEIIHKYDNYEYFNIYSHSNKDDQFFLYKIITGMQDKINKGWIPLEKSLERINIELKAVYEVSVKLKENMSTYFTTMQALIEQIWKVSIVAPGRGSAVAFLINFCLEITQVDPLDAPIEFPYWRFIHEDKVSLADIDIDFCSSQRPPVMELLKEWLATFDSMVSSIATFGTEKSKSAIITAVRSIGLDPEDGLYFASLIPSSRGALWSLKECYYGDGEDKKPIKDFIRLMDENPKVWEIAQRIEGLINKRGVHAAGIVIFKKESVFKETALMLSPSGTLTTQYSLDDLEELGCVKYDLLTTEGLDAIQTELYLLAEYGHIDWQENLKETYNKYLHPKKLDYTSKAMWEKVHNREILKLFQLIG